MSTEKPENMGITGFNLKGPNKPGLTGIKIHEGSDFQGAHFAVEGFDTAIHLAENASATINDAVLRRNRAGFQLDKNSSLNSTNVIFDEVTFPFKSDGALEIRLRQAAILNDPKLKDVTFWDNPKGSPLPSFCPKCKAVFVSRNYAFTTYNAVLWGNTEPCIVCGYGGAVLVEGQFRLMLEFAEIISAPQVTYEMFDRLSKVAVDAVNGDITPEQAISLWGQIYPELKPILKKIWAVCGGLILVLSFIFLVRADMRDEFMKKMAVEEHTATMELIERQERALNDANAVTLKSLALIDAMDQRLAYVEAQQKASEARANDQRDKDGGEEPQSETDGGSLSQKRGDDGSAEVKPHKKPQSKRKLRRERGRTG